MYVLMSRFYFILGIQRLLTTVQYYMPSEPKQSSRGLLQWLIARRIPNAENPCSSKITWNEWTRHQKSLHLQGTQSSSFLK